MTFNFLSGLQASPNVQGQLGTRGGQNPYAQLAQQAQQSPVDWSNLVAMMQQQGLQAPGASQGVLPYAQAPLQNQGAAGFSLGDRLKRFQSAGGLGGSSNLGFGGLQMMLNGWGSHS